MANFINVVNVNTSSGLCFIECIIGSRLTDEDFNYVSTQPADNVPRTSHCGPILVENSRTIIGPNRTY